MDNPPPVIPPPPFVAPQKPSRPWLWGLLALTGIAMFCGCCGTCFPGVPDLFVHPRRIIPDPRTKNVAAPLRTGYVKDTEAIGTSSDGSIILGLKSNGLIRLDPLTLKPVKSWRSTSTLTAFDLSLDGSRCAVLTRDGFAIVFDARSLEIVGKIRLGPPKNPDADRSNAIGISPNGDRIAACRSGLILTEWRVKNLQQIWTLGGTSPMLLSSIRYSPDGKWLVASKLGGGNRTVLRNPAGNVQTRETKLTAAFSPNSKFVAYETDDSTVKVRTLLSGAETSFQTGGPDYELAPNSKGEVLITGPGPGPWLGGHSEIRSPTGAKICDLDHEDAPIQSIVWWRGYAVAGGTNGRLFIFDPKTGKQLIYLKGHVFWIKQALLLKDQLLTKDGNGRLCIWNWPLAN